MPQRDVAEAQPAMPEQDPLVIRLAAGTLADDDLAELRMERVFFEPAAIDVRAQRAERSRTALPPVVDDDLVHHIGERDLDRTHRSVRDDEAAGLDPPRLEVRLGAFEARRLHHHVGSAQATLPALGGPHRLSQVCLEPLRELLSALAPAGMDADLVEVE